MVIQEHYTVKKEHNIKLIKMPPYQWSNNILYSVLLLSVTANTNCSKWWVILDPFLQRKAVREPDRVKLWQGPVVVWAIFWENLFTEMSAVVPIWAFLVERPEKLGMGNHASMGIYLNVIKPINTCKCDKSYHI